MMIVDEGHRMKRGAAGVHGKTVLGLAPLARHRLVLTGTPAPNGVVDPYPCDSVDEVVRASGEVPSHLPGTNQASEEYAKKHNLPVDAVRGGAETALPEFIRRAR